MICHSCRVNVHQHCVGRDCECPRRVTDQECRIIKETTQESYDEAERVYHTLIHTGSDVAQYIGIQCGPENVKRFVEQILRAARKAQS